MRHQLVVVGVRSDQVTEIKREGQRALLASSGLIGQKTVPPGGVGQNLVEEDVDLIAVVGVVTRLLERSRSHRRARERIDTAEPRADDAAERGGRGRNREWIA